MQLKKLEIHYLIMITHNGVRSPAFAIYFTLNPDLRPEADKGRQALMLMKSLRLLRPLAPLARQSSPSPTCSCSTQRSASTSSQIATARPPPVRASMRVQCARCVRSWLQRSTATRSARSFCRVFLCFRRGALTIQGPYFLRHIGNIFHDHRKQ